VLLLLLLLLLLLPGRYRFGIVRRWRHAHPEWCALNDGID